MNTDDWVARWEVTRAAGPVRFILRNGVMGWGSSFAGLAPFLACLIDGDFANVGRVYMMTLPVGLVAGAVYGLVMWLMNERRYRALDRG